MSITSFKSFIAWVVRYGIADAGVCVSSFTTVSVGLLNAGKLMSPNVSIGSWVSIGNRFGMMADAGCGARWPKLGDCARARLERDGLRLVNLACEPSSADSFGVHSSDLSSFDEESICMSSSDVLDVECFDVAAAVADVVYSVWLSHTAR